MPLPLHFAEFNAAEFNAQPINGIEIFSPVDTQTLRWDVTTAVADAQSLSWDVTNAVADAQCFSWRIELAEHGVANTPLELAADAALTVSAGGAMPVMMGAASNLVAADTAAVLQPKTVCGGG